MLNRREPSRSLAGLAALLLLSVSSSACSSQRRAPRDADEEAPAPSADQPPADLPVDLSTDLPTDRPPARRSAARFALAVDQSASMAGFAEAKMIEPITEAASRAFKGVGGTGETVPFYSLGAKVEKVGEKQLWDRGRFRQSRADLVAALAAPQLTSADLAVVVTDGQPTSARLAGATCSALGTEDMRALAGTLSAFLDAGRGVWLVFERRAFRGTAFLNCSVPTQAIKDAFAKKPRLTCGKECSYRHEGERVVMTIVLAAADVDEDAAKFVETYLAELGAGAEALRLHESAADRWSVRRPDLQLDNGEGASSLKVDGRGGAWTAELRCPASEVVARICMHAKAPPEARALAMGGLSAPTLQLEEEPPGDLYLLPDETGFDASALPELRASESDCPAVWARYQGLASERPAVPSRCEAKPGERTAEVVVACGCLRGDPRRASLEWRQAHAPRTRAAAQLAERFSAHPSTWYQEPDRVNGLDALLAALAARPGAAGAARVGRLELSITPPESP